MKSNILLILFLAFGHLHLNGQYYHNDVLPDLQGQDLAEALVEAFKPRFTLSESNMKDTLMARIFWEADGFVRGVYTQHEKPLDPESDDPNQDVFDNGQESGLNVEHIYPKNKGAKFGQAASDMHHLAPAKVNVNGDRNNLPFGELEDNTTDRWYWKNQELNNKPSSNIDEYSEWTNMRFEPREDFKGNVARAMFYFYTMYQSLADGEDPAYFSAQRATLCDWHYLDPVDSLEWERTFNIARYQDGKANPFVLDCSVAARLYCQDISDECERTVPTTETAFENKDVHFEIHPNPSLEGHTQIAIQTLASKDILITVVNLTGSIVLEKRLDNVNGNYVLPLDLKRGVYILTLHHLKDHQTESKKIVVQ